MKKITFLTLLLGAFILCNTAVAQSKIKDGTVSNSSSLPNANAIIELESSNKGLLLPRVALTATNNASPLTLHVAGITVYNTATAGTAPYNVTPGFYYNNGSSWERAVVGSPDYLKPLILAGGDGTDAITTTTIVSSVSGGTTNSKRSIYTKQFTLNRESLVTIAYQVSYTVHSNNNSSFANGNGKLCGAQLSFSQVPASSPITANIVFAVDASPISISSVEYMPGYFFFTGTRQLKLIAGTYTVNTEGFVYTDAQDTDGIRADFGQSFDDRIDITAVPLQ